MQQQTQLVGTYGFIVNENKEILLVQRSLHDSHPGLWELPGGGCDFGEAPEDAVKREIREETGLIVTVLYPIATISGFSSKNPGYQVVRIAYYCELEHSDQLVHLSSEHMAYQWVPFPMTISGEKSEFLEKIVATLEAHPLKKLL